MKKLKSLLITTLLTLTACSNSSEISADALADSNSTIQSALNNSPIITQNNKTTLLADGDQIFSEIFKVIDSANEKIFITTYLFGESIGHKIAEKLVEKKKQGVEIQFIAEKTMGYIPELVASAKKEYEFMKQNGIDVRYFPVEKLPKGPTFLSNKKLITHVKIVIADHKSAIIGGMNLKDSESVNHDYMIKIEGPSVIELEKITNSDYNASPSLVKNTKSPALKDEPSNSGNDTVEIAQTGFKDQSIDNLMLDKINKAQKSINIEVLLLDYKPIVDALVNAKKRGVNVRVVVDQADLGKYNAILDKLPIEGLANFGGVMLLTDAGIPVRWYIPQKKDQVLHAKVLTVDDGVMVIGSANMTYHALTRNHEMSISLNNKEAIGQFNKIFEVDWASKTKTAQLTNLQRAIGKLFQKFDDWVYQNRTENQMLAEVKKASIGVKD
jgi:cardiolipin synthase